MFRFILCLFGFIFCGALSLAFAWRSEWLLALGAAVLCAAWYYGAVRIAIE